MSRYREEVNRLPQPAFVGLLAYFAAMLGVAIYGGAKVYQLRNADPPMPATVYWFFMAWGGVNAVVAGSLLLRFAFPKPPNAIEGSLAHVPPHKLLILGLGGTLGLTTAALGVAFGYEWWDQLTGGRDKWVEIKTWTPIFLVVAGLAIMFVSLLPARSEERTSAGLRRLIYGYNAVLTGKLLLAILAVFNIMAHFYGTQHLDFTAGNIYTISDQSKRVLQALDREMQVIVVLPGGLLLKQDVMTLLDNFRSSAGDQLTVGEFSSAAGVLEQMDATQKILRQYPELANAEGRPEGLVVTTTDAEGKESYHALKRTDLEEEGMGMGRGGSGRTFKGEQAIVSAILQLREGKKNFTVYFTQGNGEFDLTDDLVRSPLDERGGLLGLKQRLEGANFGYSVKPFRLELEPGKTTLKPVPDDAFAVVVAGPVAITDPKKLDPLRDYMKKPHGRMLVLLDVRRNAEGDIQPTGMEGFLAEFGVQVGQNVILNIFRRDIMFAAEVLIAAAADKQVQEALSAIPAFLLIEARTVTAQETPQYTTKPFMETDRERTPHGQWAETARGSASQLVEYVRNLAQTNEAELQRKVNGQPLSVGVTVRTKTATNPNDHHAFMKQDEGAPRMIVMGDATFVSNAGLSQPFSRQAYLMFQNSLAWLRGKPELLTTIEPVKRNDYHLRIDADTAWKLRWFSGPAVLLVIILGGTGVWLMRRK